MDCVRCARPRDSASRTIERRRRTPPAPRPFVRHAAIVLVLAIVAAATRWITPWQRGDTSPSVDRTAETEPLGYYARGARLTGTDEQGRPAYRLFAERFDELPGEDRLQLTGVNVDY